MKWLSLGFLICAGLLTGAFALQSLHQSVPLQAQLRQDPQMSYLTLNESSPTISKKINVAAQTQALTLRSAQDPNVTFTLVSPSGETVTAANIGSRGSFKQETSSDGKIVQEVIINAPATGEWSVVYTLNGGNTGRAVLESTLMSENPLGGKVIVRYTQVQGRPFPISVAVFRGKTPIQGADVQLILTNWRTKEETVLTAVDNGDQNTGDAKAGDGLYSVNVEQLTPAFYLASAYINVTGENEIMTSNFFAVEPPTARLSGTVTDEGLDENGDGKFDHIVLNFPVQEVQKEGRYIIDAVLRGSNGKIVPSGYSVVHLKPGTTNAKIYFNTEEIREHIGVDGPYSISEVRLMWSPESYKTRPQSHITQTLGEMGQTEPYKLTDFDDVAIQLGNYLGDRGIDTNGNGQFDEIEVKFEVNSLVNLPFIWNAGLIPISGLPTDGIPAHGKNQGTLKVGKNIVTLRFNVGEYGLNGVSGPYTLRGITFTATTQWPDGYQDKGYDRLFDIESPFGTTQPYSARQLENGIRLLNADELN